MWTGTDLGGFGDGQAGGRQHLAGCQAKVHECLGSAVERLAQPITMQLIPSQVELWLQVDRAGSLTVPAH